MPKKRTLNLVAVLWNDAKIHSDEEDPLPLPTPALTIGYLVEDGDKHITLAYELFADGDMRQKQAISREMVIRIIPLRKLPVPTEFENYSVREVLRGRRPKWFQNGNEDL